MSSAEKQAILEVQHLTRIYRLGKVSVNGLVDVSFSLSPGQIVCISGKSGSGKSTLLHQVGLLDHPTSGSISINGRDLTRSKEGTRSRMRLSYLGYVFQEYALLQEITAYENVFMPGLMLGRRGVNYDKRALELLDLVGLVGRRQHRPSELSGGEQQRVAIARALINEPRILFADEPCANLDTVSSQMVMETLVRLNAELGITIIFVSHEPEDKRYATRWISLSDGKMVSDVNLKGIAA
jgi:putative ABC transport system ATP-binding protein